MAILVTPTEAEKTEKAEKQAPPMPEEKPERKPRARVDEKFKIFSGTANEPLADEVCNFLGMPWPGDAEAFCGWRGVRPSPGERARLRRICYAADLPSRG